MVNRLPAHIERRLEIILSRAKFETAKFGFDTELVSLSGMGNDRSKLRTKDEFIKSETRPFRETWLIPQIEAVLAWSRGEQTEISVEH